MPSHPTESPVPSPHRPAGASRPLAAALALAAAVVGLLFFPTESRADACYCPDGTDSAGNPVTSTTCGEQVCGADFQYYSCQESGWTFEGGDCGHSNSSDCSCTGTDYEGNTVTVNACGQQVCGADFQYYSCGETGWTAQGTSCPGEPPPPPPCYCPNGTDYLGNPVTATTCGEQVCGADFQYYSCGQTGWSAQGLACPELNEANGTSLPTPTPLDLATVTATLGISPLAWGMSEAALQNQIALSNTRVRLGRARQTLESLPETGWEWRRNEAQALQSAAQAELDILLPAEAALPAAQVERARLPVLIARIHQLEKQYAEVPGYAVQLARQSYYNGGMYSMASGVMPISDSMIQRMGLPHGDIHGDQNGGYVASMRAPNGQKVDLGHVLCAVDFNAPHPRVGVNEWLQRNPRFVDVGLPFNAPNLAGNGGMVTLAGDLGTASNYYVEHNATDGWEALMNEGHEDMRGDVDGLNVSFLLDYFGGWYGETPVATALTHYYFGGSDDTYTNRAEIFIHSSPYIADRRVLGLGYLITDFLPTDVTWVALAFSYMNSGSPDWHGVLGMPPVVAAFKVWLDRELDGQNSDPE